MQGWKMLDWKMQDRNTRVENAGLENGRKDSVWKTQCMEHRALFISAQSCSVYWVELNKPTCAYTRMQFLRAVSHSVGAHTVPDDAAGN